MLLVQFGIVRAAEQYCVRLPSRSIAFERPQLHRHATPFFQHSAKELKMDATALPQESPEAAFGLHPVLSMSRHVDELPSYVVPDTNLEMGASLGNSSCWVTTKGTGDVESVFSTFLG